MMTPYAHKITPEHLARKAIVYVRQSSDKQVQNNRESQRLQYALVERARSLGWKQVEVIDTDLGSSAAVGSARRTGFETLIASVALGDVGIVFSRELSRLIRSDSAFCQLVEVCGVFDTRVGDAEQIYDLNLMDDQLILGIKGTLSVVELKVLNMRLQQGLEAKAQRGELQKLLSPGYVYDSQGQMVKDPDRRVQDGVNLMFRKFRETWSIRQTFKWFHDQGITVPVNKAPGYGLRIVWQLPTYSFLSGILHNPVYAGAYVYGRRSVEIVLKDGRLHKRHGRLRRAEECRVFIRDHHESYIDWETFDENERMIRRNAWKIDTDESIVPARAGQGLLVGLLRCGRCGRKLRVRYSGKSGTAARYLCMGDYDAGGSTCLGFGGGLVDRRLSQELLKVLSPLGVEASLEAASELSRKGNDRRKAVGLQLQQLEYEARRAFEQYDAVDPRNRLVAGELERRWNEKLEQVERLKQELAQEDATADPALSGEDRERLMELGSDFSQVWESEHCSPELKKKIARTVLEEVLVSLDDDTQTLTFVLHWKGGTHTQFEMDKPRSGVGRKTSTKDLEVIRGMAARYDDRDIARVLTKLGRRTATGKRWAQTRVAAARHSHSIPSRAASPDPDILSLGEAARHCGVSSTTIKRLVASGLLKKGQVAPWAPWEIQRTDLEAEPVHSIVERLRKTGKLVLEGVDSDSQGSLFQ